LYRLAAQDDAQLQVIMASVEVSNARKSFGQFRGDYGVLIRVENDEFVILVGPSGCGKSTLLRQVGRPARRCSPLLID
jgi:ABC-type nitrate/sulfonate/bicarbonate transport system ATPase subunit